jgi:hypothetical protein
LFRPRVRCILSVGELKGVHMKKLLAVCLLAAPMFAASDGAINDTERAFLLDQMQKSKKDFLSSLQGMTDAQWRYKPAPNVWSVAECAEHIVLSEDFLFNTATKQVMQSPAVDRPETSNPEQDRKLAGMVADRSHKATAPEPLVPSGKINSPADAIREFTAKRDRNMEYVKTTKDDLRIHATKGPIGTMDAYQFLVLMAVHTSRHTAQIREVQANAEYPKTSAE